MKCSVCGTDVPEADELLEFISAEDAAPFTCQSCQDELADIILEAETKKVTIN